VVIQAWQGMPDGDPNILNQIIDPVGVALLNGRDTTHHGGMDFDDLLQLDHTAHTPAFSRTYFLNTVADHDTILRMKHAKTAPRMHDLDRNGIGRIPCSGQAKRPVTTCATRCLSSTYLLRLSALLRLGIHENNLCESLRRHNRLGNGLAMNYRMVGY